MVSRPYIQQIVQSLIIAVLEKLKIIDDHVAEDKEDFELNLYPLAFNKDSDNASSRSSVSLSKAPTRGSIVDSLWSRKASSATLEPPHPPLTRTSTAQTWRSERADSVVGGASIIEEGMPPLTLLSAGSNGVILY